MSRNSSPPPKRPSKSKRDEIVRAIEEVGRTYLSKADAVVLAVSGGADSMAMLHGWMEADLPRPVVAHFDHRLRAESSNDAAFVAATAERQGLAFELGVWFDQPSGRIGEKAARDARYRFLIDVANRIGAKAIAVAHTLDDQAETVLFRILRGTGVDGLAGMALGRTLRNGLWLIRPLLFTRRFAARDFLSRRGLAFHDDPSNVDPSRTRNRIRGELIPQLAEQFNPTIVEALSRLGESARDYRHLVGAHTEALCNSIPTIQSQNEVIIPAASLEELCPTERTLLLRLLFIKQHWPMGRMTAAAWERLSAVASTDGPKRWQGPDELKAIRTKTSFVIRRKR